MPLKSYWEVLGPLVAPNIANLNELKSNENESQICNRNATPTQIYRTVIKIYSSFFVDYIQ